MLPPDQGPVASCCQSVPPPGPRGFVPGAGLRCWGVPWHLCFLCCPKSRIWALQGQMAPFRLLGWGVEGEVAGEEPGASPGAQGQRRLAALAQRSRSVGGLLGSRPCSCGLCPTALRRSGAIPGHCSPSASAQPSGLALQQLPPARATGGCHGLCPAAPSLLICLCCCPPPALARGGVRL